MRGRRGAALATVLVVSSVLLLLCLALASLCVLNLNLANTYSSDTQALLLAQAAVAQLVSEEEKHQAALTAGGKANPLTVQTDHFDLTARFDNPVFPV
ncbi:MAG: hypothetical protein ACYCW6_32620, partial [Candidatus Xenobia bacterium]